MLDDAGVAAIKSLRPGGVYTLTVGHLSVDEIERLREQLDGHLPSGCKLLVLEENMRIESLSDLLMGATIG